jgi:hypothetical protein
MRNPGNGDTVIDVEMCDEKKINSSGIDRIKEGKVGMNTTIKHNRVVAVF